MSSASSVIGNGFCPVFSHALTSANIVRSPNILLTFTETTVRRSPALPRRGTLRVITGTMLRAGVREGPRQARAHRRSDHPDIGGAVTLSPREFVLELV